MNALTGALLTMAVLGLIFSLFLVLAYKKLKVEEDPRIHEIVEILPGANCGGCGYPGCSAYAEAVVRGEAPPNLCAPGGQEVAEAISKLLGLEIATMEKKVAKLMCRGSIENAVRRAEYTGIETCRVADATLKGDKACVYGCLGFGDCVRSCPFDAMYMGEEGLPHIIEEKCTGCGICVETCPRDILELVPIERKVFVFCKNIERGAVARKYCKAACIACGLCVKAAPEGTMKMENNLAVIIDWKSVDEHAEEIIAKCPTKAIKLDEKFAEVEV